MQSDIQARLIFMLASILAGWGVHHLPIDQHSADVVATAVVSAGVGWATKFYTDWNKKTVPLDAVVTPAKVELKPERPTKIGSA